MSVIEDVVRDAFARHERGEELVREACDREGPSTVVDAVAKLVASRAPRYGEALLFLFDGLEIEALASVVARHEGLRDALHGLLVSPAVRDRRTATWALGRLHVPGVHAMLAAAGDAFLREPEPISLADVLSKVELPDVVARVLESDDWLVRWSLLPWTNCATSPLADTTRRRLAQDPHPLVAAEAAQHLAVLAGIEEAAANAEGWTFYVSSNHGPAASFSALTSRFVDEWPPGKETYSVDELRAFVERSVA